MKEFARPEVSENDQILQGLLTHRNPNAIEIAQTVREVEEDPRSGIGFKSEYSENLAAAVKYHPEIKDRLVTSLAGETLIDLGGGEYPYWVTEFSTEMGVKTLVDVDYHLWEGQGHGSRRLPHDLYKDVSKAMKIEQRPGLRVAMVNADMLDFASRLKSDSVNFTINGIDDIIIKQARYHEMLADEIVRATKPGGIIIGVSSSVLRFLADRPEFEEVDDPEKHFHPKGSKQFIGTRSGLLIKKEDRG